MKPLMKPLMKSLMKTLMKILVKSSVKFLALISAFVFIGATQAAAKFELCNETSHVLDGAIGIKEPKKGWVVNGWFRLYPGFCEEVIQKNLAQKVYYVHARSAPQHAGSVRMFGGSRLLCVGAERKKINITSHVLCREKGHEKTGFARVEVHGRHWKKVFRQTQPFHSRNHAMVAGVQRLLKENGFEVGDVDGFWGKITRRSIVEFQRLAQLRPNGVINERLFEALLAGAQKNLGVTIGLKLCNETKHLVWAAVGYRAISGDAGFRNPNFESKGWLRILPKKCAMMLREKLGQPRYYIYAEAVDHHGAGVHTSSGAPLAWFGDFSMCLTRLQFRIAGRARCTQRGFEEVGFRRIETRGRAGWTEYLRNPS